MYYQRCLSYYCISLFRPQKTIWHGSDMSGDSAVDGNCDAWNSESADKRGLGSSLTPKSDRQAKLLDQDSAYDCRNFFIVLCVEITPHSGAMFSRKRRSGVGGLLDEPQPPMSRQEYEKFIENIGA